MLVRRERRAAALGTAVWLPVAIVAVVLIGAIGGRLAAYHGHITGFVQFGTHFTRYTDPPSGAVVASPLGYDGQFFYLQAHDPLLLHHSTVVAMKGAGAAFRMQRMAYPALASLVTFGDSRLLPLALLVINVLVALGLTWWFAARCRRRGRSTLWALALGLTPGLLMATVRDLSDPLAIACLLGGLLMWQDRRRFAAAALLTVAALTRETMVVAALAVALDAVWRGWGVWRGGRGGSALRGEGRALRSIAREAWPVVLVPALAFAAWHVYATVRLGGALGSPNAEFPLTNFVQEIRGSFAAGSPAYGAWDFLYLMLVLGGGVGVVASLRRSVSATGICATLLFLVLLVPEFGDVWSDTRLTAPLFALVLAVGLDQRNRRLVAIPVAAASLTLLIPAAIAGVF